MPKESDMTEPLHFNVCLVYYMLLHLKFFDGIDNLNSPAWLSIQI